MSHSISRSFGVVVLLASAACHSEPTSATAVASVSVSLDANALLVGAMTQATATLRDANGVELTGRVVAWSTDNPSVATVSGSGLVSAIGAGTAHIAAASEGQSGSATLTVTTTPPPPPGSAEPTGMTPITERPFNAAVEDNWLLPSWAQPYFTVVSDATAPKSPANVARVRYPAGWTGGDSPALEERDLAGSATTLYVSMWMKLSSNWVGHPTGTNKVIHLWINGINRVFAFADGSGSNILTPRIGLQQIAAPYDNGFGQVATGVDLRPNVAGQTGVQVIRGRWHRWEIVLVGNTPGTSNGSVSWWLDGVLVGRYTGIQYVGAGGSNTWDIIKFDPTWGGLGGTIPAEQYLYMDHLYISGKR